MPELPEVETICSDLRKKVINKKIASIVVKKKNLLRHSVPTFKKKLVGNKIKNVARRGKLIIISLNSGEYLLIHLKMTGQLIYQKLGKVIAGGHGLPRPVFDSPSAMSSGPNGEVAQTRGEQGFPNKFSHIIFTFSDKSQLFFNDMRQFGYIQIVSQAELGHITEKNYGIEPGLDNFTWDNWRLALAGRKTSIKALLLNQKIIAGIGNIYADEICHKAGIKPQRRVNKLTKRDSKRLWQASKTVIKKAIQKRGTTFSDYVDADGHSGSFVDHLIVFGKQGQSCKTCKQGIIKKIKHAGRGTHYCPNCQQ